MRKSTIGIAIAVVVMAIAVMAFAANPKAPQLTTVTVAVDGLHCKACVDELQQDLAKVPGVSEVKVTQKPGQVTAKLDESKISASKFVNTIASHSQLMDRKKTYGAKLVAYIDTEMCAKQKTMCDACFTEIPKVLKAVKGVSDVTLDDTGKVASIGFAKDATVSTIALAKALGQSDFKFKVTFFTNTTALTTDQHQHGAANAEGDCEMMKSDEGCDMGSGGGGCGM